LVFDKREEKVFKTSVRNVVAEKGFYDLRLGGATITFVPALESMETAVSKILRRITTEATLEGLTNRERY